MNIYDNVVDYNENLKINQSLIIDKAFSYGETDRFDTPVSGMVYDFNLENKFDNDLIIRLKYIIFSVCPDLKKLKLYRQYVNLFLPNERPYFHEDGRGTTCLFYFNQNYSLDEGGETQFYLNDTITGVLPKPGRLVIFDGEILHRATSFRSNPRITVALKFNDGLLHY